MSRLTEMSYNSIIANRDSRIDKLTAENKRLTEENARLLAVQEELVTGFEEFRSAINSDWTTHKSITIDKIIKLFAKAGKVG